MRPIALHIGWPTQKNTKHVQQKIETLETQVGWTGQPGYIPLRPLPSSIHADSLLDAGSHHRIVTFFLAWSKKSMHLPNISAICYFDTKQFLIFHFCKIFGVRTALCRFGTNARTQNTNDELWNKWISMILPTRRKTQNHPKTTYL